MAFPTQKYYVYYIDSTLSTGKWPELLECINNGSGKMFTSLGPYGEGGDVHRRGDCNVLAQECVWRAGYVGFATAGAATCKQCDKETVDDGCVAAAGLWTGGFASLKMLDVPVGWEVYTAGVMEDEDDDDGSIMDWGSSVYRLHRRDARPYEEGGCIVRQEGGGADCCAGTADLFLVKTEGPQPPRMELCAWCFP